MFSLYHIHLFPAPFTYLYPTSWKCTLKSLKRMVFFVTWRHGNSGVRLEDHHHRHHNQHHHHHPQSVLPKGGRSLQAHKPMLQFSRRQVLHCKLRNQGCSSTRDLIGVVASCCFPHPTLSLAFEQTLGDLERSQGHQRGGEESGFG